MPHSPSSPTTPKAPADTDLSGIRGYLFDLDGVLTPTAIVHMHAWARLFTPFLEQHGAAPYREADYFAYIDGKPRYDGVRSLLESRGIRIPEGDVTDAPDARHRARARQPQERGLQRDARRRGRRRLPGERRVPRRGAGERMPRGRGLELEERARRARGRRARRPVRGRRRRRRRRARGLPGKPAPDTFERAAELLGLPTEACAVVEDAESGVKAGAAGEFGIVIGVDRGVGRDALVELGADVVVDELDELHPRRRSSSERRRSTRIETG